MTKLTFTIPIILTTLLVSNKINGQAANSYSRIEQRFTKEQLTHEDSMAFQFLAHQKLELLFEYAGLYYENSGSKRSLKYIRTKAKDLFIINTDSTLIDSIFLSINSLFNLPSLGTNIESIQFKSGHQHFGSFSVSNGLFEVDVLLIKSKKIFGKSEDRIWQVYFANPRFNNF